MNDALSIYIHIPWCVRKCPYCDFNSHEAGPELPHREYVRMLLDDLDADIRDYDIAGEVTTVFFGGGTPSLMPVEAIAEILSGISKRLTIASNAEVTLEANPGTVSGDTAKFSGLRAVGINRLSIGIQSFANESLKALGRIHGREEAKGAILSAREAGFDNINLALMHGLPGQDLEVALGDLETALAFSPEHISWYQLTIEPNTVFYKRPPVLPDEDILWDIYSAGTALLAGAGYQRYEVSAFARDNYRCQHNLNYWNFGDYLGIGAGAHGKLTVAGRQLRTAKTRLPADYLAGPARRETDISPQDLALEFLMNAMRLPAGFSRAAFGRRTGLPTEVLDELLDKARSQGLVEYAGECIRPTGRGLQYLNSLLVMVMEAG